MVDTWVSIMLFFRPFLYAWNIALRVLKRVDAEQTEINVTDENDWDFKSGWLENSSASKSCNY